MPTYLTPGVYVEEVPSTSKPIEGVGTSIAAFVGLAPGGPVNTPMRISNWTQFAKIFGDPNEPDNGPFMDGAYLAHSVYGFFQNGGTLCWVVRVGAGGNGDGGARPQAALPAAADVSVSAFRAEALEGVDGTVNVEVVEVRRAAVAPRAAERRRRRRDHLQGHRRRRPQRPRGVRGPHAQEGPPEPRHQGQRVLEADQLEETGASLPDCAPGGRHLHAVRAGLAGRGRQATDFEGDVARRKGMGGLAAVDEVTMVCMPDIMTLASQRRRHASCATCRAR